MSERQFLLEVSEKLGRIDANSATSAKGIQEIKETLRTLDFNIREVEERVSQLERQVNFKIGLVVVAVLVVLYAPDHLPEILKLLAPI